ncbi:MAG: bis(5'-nucleosyl)-tetraphosphatase (symmetrical) YqeK [Lachnospiraceae bacterium]|nr:bis(5'-nucleosyl)-tetraphosphatase (symmetrical) YqeK [Lachnospiraceae bacterium]
MIREKIAEGEESIVFLPRTVHRYIKEHHLYEKDLFFDIGDEEISEIKRKLKKKLKRSRYTHTLGVASTCEALAMRYGYPLRAAFTAGLLHDCAKGMTIDEQKRYCREHDIKISESEKKAPWLLHAKVGADLASFKYSIDNEEILHAIRYHTTGCPDMTLLDKIVFIADYIEPQRHKQVRLAEVRAAAYIDIDLALSMILSDTIRYLKNGGAPIDETTLKTCEFYKDIKGFNT